MKVCVATHQLATFIIVAFFVVLQGLDTHDAGKTVQFAHLVEFFRFEVNSNLSARKVIRVFPF